MSTETLPAILGGVPVRPGDPPEWPVSDPAVNRIFEQLARSGDWGRYESGHVTQLRDALRQYHASEHVLLCGSGTAAVELALRGLGVKPGDEVVMSAYDFKANFTNVALLGARPVLVDIDPLTAQLDVSLVRQALTTKTVAILASHLHGNVVDMRALTETAAEAGVAVVEDACQMTGAVLQGKRAGTWGDVGVLSFGGSKLLTAGRGGAVLTNRDDVAQRIKLYTHRGNEAYPLSEMQAAVLLPQLASLASRRELRQSAVAVIAGKLPESGPLRSFFPERIADSSFDPDFYKMGLWYEPDRCEGLTRERFCEAMRTEGIPLDPGFGALHRIHARGRFTANGELPTADRADRAVVVLHHPILLEGVQAARDFLAALDKVNSHARMIREQA